MTTRQRTWLSPTTAVLKSFLSHRRRKPPYYGPFPLEIWTRVFEHLDSDATTIFATAAVCRAFNELSSLAYLTLHNSRRSISAGTYDISADTLPVLQRSLYTPPIHTITCHFPHLEEKEQYKRLQSLRSLATILRDSTSLDEVDLAFEDPLFPWHSGWPPNPLQTSGAAFLSIISTIIHVLLAKSPEEPAFLLADEPEEWSYSPIVARRQAHSGLDRRSAIKDLGKILAPMCFPDLTSIRYQRLRSGRLCTINNSTRIKFSLAIDGTCARSTHPKPSAHQLTDIITANNFNLGALELDIKTAVIDPTILSNFLTRLPRVHTVTFNPMSGEDGVRTAFIDPPVRLGQLFHISSDLNIPMLLRGIAPSGPTHVKLRFYARKNQVGVRTLKEALLAIAQHGTIRVLEITMLTDIHKFDDREIAEEIAAGGWDMVKTLHNVSAVTMNPVRFDYAHAILPWLQLFPALHDLTFERLFPIERPALRETFEQAARAAFPAPHYNIIFKQ
ncbi:hypothetical protein B0H15DRAFT_950427 [Mycena belliarum]|uniref:F-box domain-containing protein n=1 Tax=Mycena belliarum TaxID=1033014 RepID=A0AAD6U105_9AGAR|nr:hypothetical protein B0H15DRAFT_950427 [Mycena belliae]